MLDKLDFKEMIPESWLDLWARMELSRVWRVDKESVKLFCETVTVVTLAEFSLGRRAAYSVNIGVAQWHLLHE